LKQFCPVRNVTAKFPATLLIHGTKDTDVPYDQSKLMDQVLARNGVEHELITVKDAGHGLAGAKPATVSEINDRVVAFVKKHMVTSFLIREGARGWAVRV